jgi:hypothetical protein
MLDLLRVEDAIDDIVAESASRGTTRAEAPPLQ